MRIETGDGEFFGEGGTMKKIPQLELSDYLQENGNLSFLSYERWPWKHSRGISVPPFVPFGKRDMRLIYVLHRCLCWLRGKVKKDAPWPEVPREFKFPQDTNGNPNTARIEEILYTIRNTWLSIRNDLSRRYQVGLTNPMQVFLGQPNHSTLRRVIAFIGDKMEKDSVKGK